MQPLKLQDLRALDDLTITDRLRAIRASLSMLKKENAGVRPNLEILAVTKQQSVDAIREVYEAGQIHLGENYCQEALLKQSALSDLNIVWHYIGRIQSNKIKKIATHFSWIHGMDSIAHAKALSQARPSSMSPLNVCVQVNISREDSKGGVLPEDLIAFLQGVSALDQVCVRGLMAMPRLGAHSKQQQQAYHDMRVLYESCLSNDFHLDTLSMGTSHDFQLAAIAGATWVRLGEAIFGKRGEV